MGLISDILGRARRLQKELDSGRWVREAVVENEAFICELNSIAQLYEKGINAAGTEIASYAPYSPVTVEIKMMKGQPYDRVTLRDTGDFYRSFYIETDSDGFYIYAGDYKTASLTKPGRYGKDIFGLTPLNQSGMVQDFILPYVLEKTNMLMRYGKG